MLYGILQVVSPSTTTGRPFRRRASCDAIMIKIPMRPKPLFRLALVALILLPLIKCMPLSVEKSNEFSQETISDQSSFTIPPSVERPFCYRFEEHIDEARLIGSDPVFDPEETTLILWPPREDMQWHSEGEQQTSINTENWETEQQIDPEKLMMINSLGYLGE